MSNEMMLEMYEGVLEGDGPIARFLPGTDIINLAAGIALSPSLTEDQKDLIIEMLSSYKGVKPRKVGDYIGKWLVCLGCILLPFERSYISLHPETGAECTVIKHWNAPLFKLERKDDEGDNIILAGGGANAVDFCKDMAILGRAGDWVKPKEIYFSQEERTVTNRSTGETGPGRLYRIRTRPVQKG